MTQMVELVIDEQAIRQKLRYAFANHDTAVQELLQNARRAGASQVDLTYNPETLELIVKDDGTGVEDFAVLMRAGASGWDGSVATTEKPYGLGFLAAIYAARHVRVTSRGQCLAFDTAEIINHGKVAITQAAKEPGTTIILQGFEWKLPESAARAMARGYPIRVTYNGAELGRPDAVAEHAHRTPVGSITLCDDIFRPESARIYLQGFLVKDSRSTWLPGAIVHLDSTRYLGKFPDRNVVIDQANMVKAVDAQVRALYEERLAEMRETLDPLGFCKEAYSLAASLGKLTVFDEIDTAPGEWLRKFETEPYSTWDSEDYTTNLPDGTFIKKAEVQAGSVRVCHLDGFDVNDSRNQLQWFFAWRDGQLVLNKQLSPSHWLVKHADMRSDSDVTLEVVGARKRAAIPTRTSCVWGDIELCEAVEITANGRNARISDTAIATLIEDSPVIFVPIADDACSYPLQTTLKQVCTYVGELDAALEEELSCDVEIVCSRVLDLITESPAERTALAIQRAIRDIDELRSISCQLLIDGEGRVTVSAFEER